MNPNPVNMVVRVTTELMASIAIVSPATQGTCVKQVCERFLCSLKCLTGRLIMLLLREFFFFFHLLLH